MSSKSDEHQDLTPKDMTFILAIAGRLDAQCRIVAKNLHDDRYAYYGYAILDSASCSYSMFKYYVDVFIGNIDNDKMHDLMMTSGCIAAISCETLFLVSFALLAARFDGEDDDELKQLIVAAWPYFRDMMKALKNAYKGWKSAIQLLNMLNIVDLKHLIIPLGLVLGVISVVNRLWLRSMIEKRKVMMEANGLLISEIKELTSLTKEESEVYLIKLQYQSLRSRILSYVGAMVGGLIDGLYLYVGVIGLAVLAPPFLTAIAAMCAFYTLVCVITRGYEEYDFQLKLSITHTSSKLLLIKKELETSYEHLLLASIIPDRENLKSSHIINLEHEVYHLIERFEKSRQLLHEQTNRSYLTAALFGLKNGLYAYGALSSIMFMVGTVLTICSVSFPPALLFVGVALGVVFIAGFIAYSLRSNYLHINKEKKQEEKEYQQLISIKKNLHHLNNTDTSIDYFLIDNNSFRNSVKKGLDVDPSPQFYFQEWFEVIRSFFSGAGKGQKFVGFAGFSLQELDEQGHYQDTPIMFVLSALNALFFGLVLSLRAFARGFGRSALGRVDLDSEANLVKNSLAPQSSVSLHRFFSHKPQITHSQSENVLDSTVDRVQSRVQGLG